MVIQRLGLVIVHTDRLLRDLELGVVRQPFVLRGRRLRGPGDHVQRDDLVGAKARRLLGLAQFGLVRNEFVLRGRRSRGPGDHVRRDDLVGSEARRLLGFAGFGLVRNEFVLRGRRLRGPSDHVQRDDLVTAAIDGPVRPLLLFGLMLVKRLLCRRELPWRRDQLRRVSLDRFDPNRSPWRVDGCCVCWGVLHRGGPLRQLRDLQRLCMVDAYTARSPGQSECSLMHLGCVLCGRRWQRERVPL